MLKLSTAEWKEFINKLEVIKTKSNREVYKYYGALHTLLANVELQAKDQAPEVRPRARKVPAHFHQVCQREANSVARQISGQTPHAQ